MQSVALLIGISEFPHADFSSLPAAVENVRALKKVLCHPEMGLFTESNVTVLENP
uniref:Uncharacterized protein n=1 Tax=Candidatus Kentrum sp. FW TaxID=2126338 RepID=A0A450TKA8_9GAMM|nr:MAG: hypothetical protein BECKFW1821C_GA0114237_101330 [Candidatus Kentron sp. FW]